MKKNKLLIIISSILLIYSIIGFIAIPKLLKPQIVKALNENLTQKASLEKIEFNPFLLKFSLFNLKIYDDKNKDTVKVGKISIDFSVFKSIEEKHIHFKDLNIINPYVHIIEYEDGSINLLKLIKEQNNKAKKEVEKDENTSDIKFQIFKTALKNAKIKFTKLSKDKPFNVDIDKFNYTFYDVGTYKNILASHTLSLLINNHTKLSIKGGVKLSPFKMYGNVVLKNLKPNDFLAYKKDLLNFDIDKKTSLDFNFGYNVNTEKAVNINIKKANLLLKDFNLLQNKNPLVSFKSFNIKNLSFKYPENSIKTNSISLDKLNSNIIIDNNNTLNFTTLVKQNNKGNVTKEEKTSNSVPWSFELKSFNLNNSSLNFEDQKRKLFVNTKGSSIDLKSFKISDKNISIKDVVLGNKSVKFEDLNNKLNIEAKNEKIQVLGTLLKGSDVNISKVKISEPDVFLKNNLNKTDIFAKKININIDKTSYLNGKLSIASTNINKPFISFILNKQKKKKTTKVKKAKTKKSVKEEPKGNFAFDIGPVKINNMDMRFQDKNLPIPFKTNITKLNGEFSRLNSNSSKPTKMNLEGAVDKYGYTKIVGTVDINDIKLLTDTNLLFKNIAIKNFTPYSGKFVGREIESGKLNLDLKYNIKKSNLNAKNSILISDIKLGKKVKSKDAMNLPLELAIALLEDSNGVIDLQLPITGNVDDPKFSIAPIVWKVFTNLIIKAVTSPFTLLASIFGIDEEKIKSIEFEFGKSSILVSEKESLDNIAKILSKKPKLAIKVKPKYDLEKDTKALQNIKFEKVLKEQMKKISKGDAYKEVLENLYKKQKDVEDIEKIKTKFIKQTKDKKEVFDKDSYLEYLKDLLASKQIVKENELIDLVNKRVKTIINYLTVKKKIDKKAIKIEDIEKQNKPKNRWVVFDFDVTTK